MKFLIFMLFIIKFNAFAETCPDRGPNVILFTWDGVRNKEFFKGSAKLHLLNTKSENDDVIFEKFWKKHAYNGTIYGGLNTFSIASKIALSLPSYQAMLAGKATSCRSNNCGAIQEETFLESVRKKLKLEKKDVAVFASWSRILHAIAKNPDEITYNIFPHNYNDPGNDPFYQKLQEESLKDLPPWKNARKDHYTFEMAKHYLRKNCPRLMHISLLDSDEYGHAGDFKGYISSLKIYDDYLDELISFLNAQGAYGKNTTLIVTTDHSRGNGPLWREHGLTKNANKSVFLYMRGRAVTPKGRSFLMKGSHLMLRPTIETLFGLETENARRLSLQF